MSTDNAQEENTTQLSPRNIGEISDEKEYEKHKFYYHQFDTYKKFILTEPMREKCMKASGTDGFKDLLEEMNKQAEAE